MWGVGGGGTGGANIYALCREAALSALEEDLGAQQVGEDCRGCEKCGGGCEECGGNGAS